LSPEKDNAILIVHALSGDAHVAGYNSREEDRPGWWDNMVGPGKAMDTDKYFVICSNILGGCRGSTGPSSVYPQTGRPYGLAFPVVTVKDMVNAQKVLVEHLGVERLLCVIGGSLGGMQVLEWAVSYPEMVRLAIPIASTSRLSAQAIAFDEVGRQAIMADPDWMGGDYYGKTIPHNGLAIARMIGHITYMSDKSMHDKFGRALKGEDGYHYAFSEDFEVESYLHYKGNRFVERFDANSYLYITKAMDYFDLQDLSSISSKMLIVSFSSDWLFPSAGLKALVRSLRRKRKDVTYCEVQSSRGHDAFLLEVEPLTDLISGFLENAGS